jgi:hypothetical protein
VGMMRCPSPLPGVVVEDLERDVCLYRVDTDEVLVLNQSGGDVWRLADGATPVEIIIEQLALAYQVDQETIRADVVAVIEDLGGKGFLVDAAADEGSP